MVASVLIVDDSATIRQLVVEALADFEVLEAKNGRDGLDVLESSPAVELVICDINMPVMGGIEMLRQLEGRVAAGLRVVMLSTEGSPSLLAEAKRLGAAGWVHKPFEAWHLLSAARKLLRDRPSTSP